ncbi:hypothetical protein SAMN02910298_01953 [Pseudobutyrivibrio sp. YE44]|uniref:hypothetical protein n=1 Tax=Pseudobutyrivibrio sp. YE44 TaxID=1520802 RepID=UPI00088D1026|nr:hypothetical protein [Pseudobutyrivibrio sp. YE44]SDB40034.1 hypothetical protein SAMN02910298_01953 [Pseudobutyrivibrio sp. YE44]
MFNSNATTINEQMSFYSTLAIILMVIAIVLFVAAIVMWFVFKIPHSFRVLTGAGVDKEIRQLSSATKTGTGYVDSSKKKAVISWNTSTNLNVNMQEDETELLMDDSTLVLGAAGGSQFDPEATMVLGAENDSEATMVLGAESDPDATMVLDNLDYDPDATMVLDETLYGSGNSSQPPAGFEIEDEIIITGNSIKRN